MSLHTLFVSFQGIFDWQNVYSIPDYMDFISVFEIALAVFNGSLFSFIFTLLTG